jgi:hypothetical protein
MLSRQKNNAQIVERIQYSFVPNHRDTMQALARAKFNNCEFRIIVALMNQTDGYLREEDELSTGFWQSITLMGRQSVTSALSSLLYLSVISRNDRAYRLNHPNQWDPGVFQPQRLSRRSIRYAKALLEREKDKHGYSWLARTLRKAEETSPVSDAIEADPALPSEVADETSLGGDVLESKAEPLEAAGKLPADGDEEAQNVTNQGRSVTNQGRSASPTSDDLNVPKESLTKESSKESHAPEDADGSSGLSPPSSRMPGAREQEGAGAPSFKEALRILSDARNKPAALSDIVQKKFPDYKWSDRGSARSRIGRCGMLLKTFGIRRVLQAIWLTETQAREGDPLAYAQAILIAKGKIPGRGEATQHDFKRW